MNEEMKMILEMVSEGKVSVEEAQKLIEAIGTPPEAAETAQTAALEPYKKGVSPKRIVVYVTQNGKPMVNLKVPFSLVKIGLKLGKGFGGLKSPKSPEEARALEALQDLDIDELIESIGNGDITLPYTMVDVDDIEKGETVKIEIQ